MAICPALALAAHTLFALTRPADAAKAPAAMAPAVTAAGGSPGPVDVIGNVEAATLTDDAEADSAAEVARHVDDATLADDADAEGAAEVVEHVDAAALADDTEADRVASGPASPAVHGLAFVSVRAPADGASGLSLFLVQGEVDGRQGPLQLYVTARLRVLPDGGGPEEVALFLQQAYGAWHHRFGALKLGKITAAFGRPWDYGFYGPLLANLDAKQQPELGVAAEGSPSLGKGWELAYALQYFPVDGRSFALRNRVWFARDNVRREHQLVARAAPVLRFGEARHLSLGLSYNRLTALRGPVPGGTVHRGAIDLDGRVGALSAFVEAGRQAGQDQAIVGGQPIDGYRYLWAGAMVAVDPVKVRYHVNLLGHDDRSWDVLHQPGVEVDLHDRVGVLLEAALWRGGAPDQAATWREQALYLVLNARV